MLRVIVTISLCAVVFAQILPADAGQSREGVPGRRTGGGTRWTAPRTNRSALFQSKLSASIFASRAQIPMKLCLKAFFPGHTAWLSWDFGVNGIANYKSKSQNIEFMVGALRAPTINSGEPTA